MKEDTNISGTKSGGEAAARTNKERYGADYYAKIAKKSAASWVANGRKPKGFAAVSKEKRAEAGRRGGQASRRFK